MNLEQKYILLLQSHKDLSSNEYAYSPDGEVSIHINEELERLGLREKRQQHEHFPEITDETQRAELGIIGDKAHWA